MDEGIRCNERRCQRGKEELLARDLTHAHSLIHAHLHLYLLLPFIKKPLLLILRDLLTMAQQPQHSLQPQNHNAQTNAAGGEGSGRTIQELEADLMNMWGLVNDLSGEWTRHDGTGTGLAETDVVVENPAMDHSRC